MKSSFFAYSLLIVVLVAVVLSPSPSSAQAPLDAQTLLGLVSNVMSTLPPCSIPCLQQLPGFSTSLTVAFLTAMCTNPNATASTLSSCVNTACPATQGASARSFIGQIPSLCGQLPANLPTNVTVSLTLPTATAVSTTAAPTSAPATTKPSSAGSSYSFGTAGAILAISVGLSQLF